MNNKWLFLDPPNTAVFISRRILDGEEWIYYVSHDTEDGAWQFHPKSGPTPESETAIVALRVVIDLDPSIISLMNLPLGYCAWRDERTDDWQIASR